MPSIPGTNKINVEFHLTPDEALHVFTQWKEDNPKVKVEEMSLRNYQNAIREVLAAKGWQAVNTRLSDSIEIKKLDYKAAMKGILP